MTPGAVSPPQVYAALHGATGGRLFTVTVLDRAAGLARRVYSSDPVAYPVSGTKPMGQGAWTDQVIDRAEVFVANTVAAFAPYFADHAQIEGLGCGSAMNVPIVDGQVIGTVNILDQAQYFTPDTVARLRATIDDHQAALVAAFRAEVV
ncbi:MAG: GAF domain-containing protein [Pseudomonadota bacterium]